MYGQNYIIFLMYVVVVWISDTMLQSKVKVKPVISQLDIMVTPSEYLYDILSSSLSEGIAKAV